MSKKKRLLKLAYRPKEIEQALGVSATTVRKFIIEGKLEAVRIGRVTLVRAESLERLLRVA